MCVSVPTDVSRAIGRNITDHSCSKLDSCALQRASAVSSDFIKCHWEVEEPLHDLLFDTLALVVLHAFPVLGCSCDATFTCGETFCGDGCSALQKERYGSLKRFSAQPKEIECLNPKQRNLVYNSAYKREYHALIKNGVDEISAKAEALVPGSGAVEIWFAIVP